jgi:protein TonB
METKKNPKADLEKYKALFLLIGFVVTLSIILAAFEWTTSEITAGGLGTLGDVEVEEEIIPVTRQELAPPPPPPPPQQVAEVLNIVEDEVEIDEEMEIEDMEVDQETEIEIIEIEEEEEEAQIFFIVEEMPEFPGGDLELRKYIAKNIRYPNLARENDIQGKVYVRFAVTATGAVKKVTVARGVDPLLDAEAIRVVKSLPKWKPGKQRGKPVNVWYTVPINFQLQ